MAAWVALSTSNPRRTMSWPGQGRGPPTPPGPCQSTSIFAGPTPLLLPSLLRPSSFLRGESLNRIQGAGGSGGSGPNPVPHQAMRSSCQSNPLNFLPRLVVPNKGYSSLDQSPDEKPLVALDTDSDDDFDMSRYSSSGYSSAEQINQDLNIQLLKDGYRLDEIPDDEDLDLIPPKSVNPTCMCCQATSSTACHIQ
uniref:Family with sequence similarity 219 member A n=1 Tax=Ailuropoda melanoleuca TaxID=9646 RepID=A0A7N5KQP8_AILME